MSAAGVLLQTDTALIRLQFARTGDRTLDTDVSRAFGLKGRHVDGVGYREWSEDTRRWKALPRYTTSLDAMDRLLRRTRPHLGYRLDSARPCEVGPTPFAEIFLLLVPEQSLSVFGATPALALATAGVFLVDLETTGFGQPSTGRLDHG